MEDKHPIISWVGATTGYYPTRLNTRVGTLTNNKMSWGTYNSVSGLIRSASNSSNSSVPQRTLISWTDMYGSKWQKREGTTYNNPSALSHSGYWTQSATDGSFSSPRVLVFNNTTSPYYFVTSTNDFYYSNPNSKIIINGEVNSLNKITETDTIVTFGRSGVVSINDIEFVFEIGDIIVGDTVVTFIEKPDTIVYNSTNELNQDTKTKNFILTSGTNFLFSNVYYVVQKSDPETSLLNTDMANFKVELVNAITDQVAGTFDNITYNKNNLEKYANMDYSVDCSGIVPGEYYLRLVTSVIGNADYTLVNLYNGNKVLEKNNYTVVNFEGNEIITNYELAQNFPNPFNPNTTILYQVPQDGIVNLKIYDILGAEVTTLVNEQKKAGKHEVKFNASALSSGIYIYKLQAGDFVSSKKMILLK